VLFHLRVVNVKKCNGKAPPRPRLNPPPTPPPPLPPPPPHPKIKNKK